MAELPKPKECPATCPKCGKGDLAGGGPLACRYTCGHVVSKGALSRGRAWNEDTAKMGTKDVKTIKGSY